ncbi:MAG: HAD-IC family P-type ATPase, partial [Candidatus Gastranaerophilales bacterium]|nr:HAD-IC family P-type ATPase [Candidatus Gastranaerophilales bacterium]
ADIRILKQTGIMADESLLTGESAPVIKITGVIEETAPLSDRENMLFAGTTIASGRGLGVVADTGLRTEIGIIAESVATTQTSKPPLLKRMEVFSHQISLVVLGASAIIAVIEVSRGFSAEEVFFIAVALAVSAIPEGLPAALTAALSVGVARMAKRNVIIRKLTAIEGLGSCTLIASDKTGTLTVNKQTVKLLYLPDGAMFNVTGEGYNGEGGIIPHVSEKDFPRVEDLVKCGVICNEGILVRKGDSWEHQGDEVDVALLALSYKFGLAPLPFKENIEILREIPFESERKFSALFYRGETGVKVAVKGALEVILPFCSTMKYPQGDMLINPEQIEEQVNNLTASGYRVIAFAHGDITTKHDHSYYETDLANLTFLGLAGLIDPLRPEAKEAVKKCKSAGIRVIMITGDHPETAFTIGRELGIVESHENVMRGADLEKIDRKTPQFREAVEKINIFARVTPIQKLHIVEDLIEAGNFIAVTGDGVNDAPALKKSHIGIAMGTGTDVAKDVASIIVVDDNFASVVAGVEEGRFAYDNIRKVIYLLTSTGVAELMLFLLSVGLNTPLPLVAVQLLWLNLVTNGIQGVALAFEKGEKETMEQPPRSPKEGIFNRLMIEETLISGISMGIIVFILWFVLLSQGVPEFTARNLALLFMVLFENIHIFNCRSERKSAFKVPLSNNWLLITGIIASQALHIASMNMPFMQGMLHIEPIKTHEWGYLLALASSILLIMETYKYFKRNRNI